MKKCMRIVLALVAGGLLCVAVLLGLVTQPLVWNANVPPVPAVSEAALETHVRLLAERWYPRSFDQRENLEAAADYIHAALRKTGAPVYDQWFEVDGARYRNILACYGPAAASGSCDPASPPAEGAVFVGTHYDSHGDTDVELPPGMRFSPDTHTPGADDNASGVAGLLELARLLGENPPAKPVVLVAYTLEEPPHFRTESMGSAAHARSLKAAGVRAKAVIVLEMIGFFSDAPGSQRFPVPGLDFLYPDTGNFIAIVGRLQDAMLTRRVKSHMRAAGDLPVYSINAPPELPGIDFSDHSSYWGEGYSAVMVTDTAFYRDTVYHTARDTADRLDYKRMAKVVQGVFAAVTGM